MNMETHNPPTYPARPINGGKFDLLEGPDYGFYSPHKAEPKINDWRALICNGQHPVEMWNRRLERFTNADKFTKALDWMNLHLPMVWIDACCMGLRTPVAKGCIAVLDHINFKPSEGREDPNYAARRLRLQELIPEIDLDGIIRKGTSYLFPNVFILPAYPKDEWEKLWRETLPAVNKALDCEFVEGFVVKDELSVYPRQLHSPDKETASWVKFRWRH